MTEPVAPEGSEMLLDHRQNVAGEMQAGWRADADQHRLVSGERGISTGQATHHVHLEAVTRAVGSLVHGHHVHLSLHGRAFTRGH